MHLVIVISHITEVKCVIQLVTNQNKRKLFYIDKVIQTTFIMGNLSQ